MATGTVILGHGIDHIDVARIAALRARHGEGFGERLFSPAEITYCEPRKRADEHFAVRFAAKEAVLKAIGTGFIEGIGWRDVEVTRDAAGKPGVALHGGAAVHAERLGVTGWLLSLSHSETIAFASAIALGNA